MTTVNELISKAKYYIGYEEKASNANLEDFHANRGRNNYTKFQPLAGAGNGDYWCQYFIDGIAVVVAAAAAATAGGGGGAKTGLKGGGGGG